ncbi:flagellar hook protein FlgE [Desulfovibrio sp. JC010]|uniref:flagellar hook protein FlgE n=1 Tax=Desulfovibrio sp. JC010 TaxID=2593641 RepID=UPI0013D0B788|nr:flagellar hook-basal body complex protein [Desulfovibrio sp. JC010]NDV25633.1 flagellar hook-basal body complex protein [Desulfovibrio sp. JC010]
MGFSSMYTAATGVKSHGVLLQQIGANLANVNTLAYKSGDTFLETLGSATSAKANSGIVANQGHTSGQIGLGSRVAATRINFKEGAFQNSSSSTDIAIGGQGFFRVADPGSGGSYYTRAGNFHFDKNGLLVDSHNNILQGYSIDQDGNIGTTSQNIALPMKEETDTYGNKQMVVKSDPKGTDYVNMRTNLDSGAVDNSETEGSPFFSLLTEWDGTSNTPLTADEYEYNSSIQIYDDNGNKHDLIVYFDKVVNDGDSSDKRHWEYVVTVPPGSDAGSLTGTSGAGLVMAGTLTFSGDGTLLNQSAFTLAAGATDGKDLANWEQAALNSNGQPTFSVTLSGATGTPTAQTVAFDMGITSGTDSWDTSGVTAADIGSNASSLPGMEDGKLNALATTDYYGSSSTISQSQDGYGEGYLQNVAFNSDGILSALFSNGMSQDLYQVNLYNFKNEYGLRREGSNYFSATTDSGAAIQGVARKDGLGSVVSNTLETSNVDLADEFAYMILTQRGFQANSKGITTTDSLINTALGIKK